MLTFFISNTTVALELNIFSGNLPVTGASPTAALRKKDTATTYLDFDDLTFKTSGWTTQNYSLTEVSNGLYRRTFDSSTPIKSPMILVAEYTYGSYKVSEDLLFMVKPAGILDIANYSGSGSGGMVAMQQIFSEKDKTKLFFMLDKITDKIVEKTVVSNLIDESNKNTIILMGSINNAIENVIKGLAITVSKVETIKNQVHSSDKNSYMNEIVIKDNLGNIQKLILDLQEESKFRDKLLLRMAPEEALRELLNDKK